MTETAHDSLQLSASNGYAHEHGWEVESRHATSAGTLLYVRCGACGTRRVDLQERGDLPPVPLSVETGCRIDDAVRATR